MKKVIRYLIGAAIGGLLIMTAWLATRVPRAFVDEAPDTKDLTPGATIGTLRVGALDRSYQLYVPTSASSSSRPLVVFFTDPEKNLTVHLGASVVKFANENDIVVVYPHAAKKRLDANGNWVPLAGWQDQITDVANDNVMFVGALIEHLIANYPVDASRIYLIGSGTGGDLVFRYALQRPAKVAAIAVKWLWASIPRKLLPLPELGMRDSQGTVPALFVVTNDKSQPTENPWCGAADAPRAWIAAFGLVKLGERTHKLRSVFGPRDGVTVREERWKGRPGDVWIEEVPFSGDQEAIYSVDWLKFEWTFLKKWRAQARLPD